MHIVYIIHLQLICGFPIRIYLVHFTKQPGMAFGSIQHRIACPKLDGMANDIFVHIADCIGTQPQVGSREGLVEEEPPL